jgi:methyl-accepting chemotaxis protein
VGESVDGITQIINQNSGMIQQMAASSQEMSAQVDEIVASTQSLDGMAKELSDAVASMNLTESAV